MKRPKGSAPKYGGDGGSYTPFALGIEGESWFDAGFLFVPLTPGGNRGLVVLGSDKEGYNVVWNGNWHPAENLLMATAICHHLKEQIDANILD